MDAAEQTPRLNHLKGKKARDKAMRQPVQVIPDEDRYAIAKHEAAVLHDKLVNRVLEQLEQVRQYALAFDPGLAQKIHAFMNRELRAEIRDTRNPFTDPYYDFDDEEDWRDFQ